MNIFEKSLAAIDNLFITRRKDVDFILGEVDKMRFEGCGLDEYLMNFKEPSISEIFYKFNSKEVALEIDNLFLIPSPKSEKFKIKIKNAPNNSSGLFFS